MKLIAGVDEAGRGSIAGPVVAAAVILKPNIIIKDLKDSKKLSENKRDFLFNEISDKSIAIGIGVIHEDVIEEINILKATYKAMQLAIGKLTTRPHEALIDGFPLPDQIIKNKGVIGGDNIIPVISAASIVAKVSRDRIMKNYSIVFPNYDFHKNKGYGTKGHISLLQKNLASPIHRKSFRPVPNYMPTFNKLIEDKKILQWTIGLISRELVRKNHTIINVFINNSGNKNFHIISQENNVVVFTKIDSILGKNSAYKKKFVRAEIEDIKNKIHHYKLNKSKYYQYRFDRVSIIFGSEKPIIKYKKKYII